MRKLMTYSLFILTICISCKKKEIVIDKNYLLYDLYDGNYNLIEAYSANSVDINMDGISSTNLVLEIPNLKLSDFDVIIGKSAMRFRLHWPEQIRHVYDMPSQPEFNYAIQGDWIYFNFNDDNTSIKPDIKRQVPTSDRLPDEIKILNGLVKIKLTRKLYTQTGLQDVVINATYKKNNDFKQQYN